jgi:pyruvate ferredoxin oxidoreductase alpha subunit
MAMRDSGWLQIYAVDNQEAADLHIQAFKIAEELSLPVMVCVDGFVLTHAMEPVAVPEPAAVDGFLPPFEPRQVLDPANPYTIGAMVGPDDFTEVRYLQHVQQLEALKVIPRVAAEFKAQFGRDAGGLLEGYRSEGAETIVLALGSVNGTLQEVVDELRDEGTAIGSVALKTYRPFPFAAVRDALGDAKRVIVLERALAPGIGGIVIADVMAALAGLEIELHTVIAGLGGRAITRRSLRGMLEGELGELHFLDLHRDVIEKELAR